MAENVFKFLRHKSLTAFQKPIVTPKKHSGNDDHLAAGFSSYIREWIDCSLHEFERIVRVIRLRVQNATFQPSFASTQLPSLSYEVACITFDTFNELADCMGIESTTDRLEMLRKQKVTDVPAFRILGSMAVNRTDENLSSVLMVGSSMTNSARNDLTEARPVLYRDSRVFDKRNLMYDEPLMLKDMSVDEVRDAVGAARIADRDHLLTRPKSVFACDGRPTPLHNVNILAEPQYMLGQIEVIYPFLIVRGRNIFRKYKEIIPDEFLYRDVLGVEK